ncbi:MAG: hypothetical protein F4103_19210 [Boseongicola sp. SB0673_bin_14]|nr:hypothetical protein [Boseongicola sp. SB0673_bin_14]
MGTALPLQASLDPDLLNPLRDVMSPDLSFEAALDVHGKYETRRFVLSLSPRNHELLEQIEAGLYALGAMPADAIQAYSTYIHETVHWWQHVGSTSGLMLSLSYLAQSYSNLTYLRRTLKEFGPIKPLKRWADEKLCREGASAQARLADANIAINNALDVEYYRRFAMHPGTESRLLQREMHFESVGHSYDIACGQLIGMVSAALDPDLSFLPDARAWEAKFMHLASTRHEGFYHGSPIRTSPVGLHAIYEGQARFVQLQFLDGTQTDATTTAFWREQGYLSGIYVEAFEAFLHLSDSRWPDDLRDPLVSMFLLICDLAINPTRGFPLDIEIHENFIRDIDVGARFSLLCQGLARARHLKRSVTDHSREEYAEISEELVGLAGYDHPFSALTEVNGWMSTQPEIQGLMEEYRTFEFGTVNLPVRVFLSHHMAFCVDRLKNPQFFCWPGFWKTSGNDAARMEEVWLRHLSLFTNRGEKSGVYPRRWPDRDEDAIKNMFEEFYASMAVFDLTRQWILQEGEFVCDYRWLFENYAQSKADAWANDTFRQMYGVELADFEILPADE